MKKQITLILTPWKNVDWRKAEEELKVLQAKLYEALKDNASQEEIATIHNHIITSFSGRAIQKRQAKL